MQNISESQTAKLIKWLPSFPYFPLSYLFLRNKKSSFLSNSLCEGVFFLYPMPETQFMCKNLWFFGLLQMEGIAALYTIFYLLQLHFVLKLHFPVEEDEKE